MRETPIQLFDRAVKNGRVDDLFAGRNGYVLPPDKTVDALIPADYNLLFYWIHKNCQTQNRQVYKNAVTEAIIKLLNGSAEEIYFAYEAFFSELFLEINGRSAFKICDEDFIQYVREKCLENKEALISCHKWTGAGEAEGVWKQMQDSCKRLNDFYGVSIL